MKLGRSRPLVRRSPLRSRPRRRKPSLAEQEARMAWLASKGASCAVCRSTDRLHLHHVVYEQHVRAEHGDVHDPRNGLTLCEGCHFSHHRRWKDRQPWQIPIQFVPEAAFAFSVDLLGEIGARDYLRRYYDTRVTL